MTGSGQHFWYRPEHCECVKYVVRSLFDQDSLSIPGTWDTAAQMADDQYWGTYDANYAFRVQVARPGDAIIFQPDAPFEVLVHQYGGFIGYRAYWENVTLDNGAGHIGLVTSADYHADEGKWYISMKSANWESHSTSEIHKEWVTGLRTESGCWNVGDSEIKVPNGPGISFWRPGPFEIVSNSSGKCVDVPGATNQDVALSQYSCNQGDNQRWLIRGDSTQPFVFPIISTSSGKCMDVPGSSTQNGTGIMQYSCNYGGNQKWLFQAVGDGTYNILSKSSGKCLDVEQGSTQDGARIIQYDCHGGDNQRWWLR